MNDMDRILDEFEFRIDDVVFIIFEYKIYIGTVDGFEYIQYDEGIRLSYLIKFFHVEDNRFKYRIYPIEEVYSSKEEMVTKNIRKYETI